MSRPRGSALERPNGRDAALLADVLQRLQAELDAPLPESVDDTHVEDLVVQALAAIQRVQGVSVAPVGVAAPVLGAGVLQEILRQRRQGAPRGEPSPSIVDTTR